MADSSEQSAKVHKGTGPIGKLIAERPFAYVGTVYWTKVQYPIKRFVTKLALRPGEARGSDAIFGS